MATDRLTAPLSDCGLSTCVPRVRGLDNKLAIRDWVGVFVSAE